MSANMTITAKNRIPQKEVPKVNHWIPDANANKAGVLDLMTPANAPIVIPVTPI